MTEKLYNLGRVTTGQPMQTAVTAERLNRTAKNFEAIGRVIGTVAEGYIQDVGDTQDGSGGIATLPSSATVTETSRTTSAKVVTDSNGDTFTLNITTQIVAAGTWSDGSPLTLTINLAPPT